MEKPEELLRLYVCGRLALVRGERLVSEPDFPARQGRRLWAYLVLHRAQPMSSDDLAGAVWADSIPDAWESALHALVSRLRRTLIPVTTEDGPLIAGEPGRYHFASRRPPSSISNGRGPRFIARTS